MIEDDIRVIHHKSKINKNDIDKVSIRRKEIENFIKTNYVNYTKENMTEYIKFCEICSKIGEMDCDRK